MISGGTAFNGTGQFKFAIVSSDGSTFYWKNDGTTTAEAPATAVSLPVNKGLFSVQLGDAAIVNMGTIGSSVLSTNGLKLRVWFHDGVKNWQQFSPDQRIRLPPGTSINSYENEAPRSKSSFFGTVSRIIPDSSLVVWKDYLLRSNGIQFWRPDLGFSEKIFSYEVDLVNQLPHGCRIFSILVDCFDSAPLVKSQYDREPFNLGSVRAELIMIDGDGKTTVIDTKETGSAFTDGLKRLEFQVENLNLVNGEVNVFRLKVYGAYQYSERYINNVPSNAAGQILRLDRIVVNFK